MSRNGHAVERRLTYDARIPVSSSLRLARGSIEHMAKLVKDGQYVYVYRYRVPGRSGGQFGSETKVPIREKAVVDDNSP